MKIFSRQFDRNNGWYLVSTGYLNDPGGELVRTFRTEQDALSFCRMLKKHGHREIAWRELEG